MAAMAELVAVDAREAAASKTEPLSADSLIGLGREQEVCAATKGDVEEVAGEGGEELVQHGVFTVQGKERTKEDGVVSSVKNRRYVKDDEDGEKYLAFDWEDDM
ncbi:unnamed protein product [Caretta caretta]